MENCKSENIKEEYLVDLQESKPSVHASRKAHRQGVSCVKFSPDGTQIASSSADKLVKIWSLDGTCKKTLRGHKLEVSEVSWSSDSKFLVSASDDSTVRIWDTQEGKPIKILQGHHGYAFCCNFNRQGTLVVSGSFDESVRLWDVQEGFCIKTLVGHTAAVIAVQFNPESTLVISCSYDSRCCVWDIQSGHCLKTIVSDGQAISHARLTPNGKYLLIATLDECIRLWDYRKGQGRCLKSFQGHKNKNYCIFCCFGTIDGKKWILSGSEDNALFIWDLKTTALVWKLEEHENVVLSCDFHPTLPLLVSGSLDKTLKIWKWGS